MNAKSLHPLHSCVLIKRKQSQAARSLKLSMTCTQLHASETGFHRASHVVLKAGVMFDFFIYIRHRAQFLVPTVIAHLIEKACHIFKPVVWGPSKEASIMLMRLIQLVEGLENKG